MSSNVDNLCLKRVTAVPYPPYCWKSVGHEGECGWAPRQVDRLMSKPEADDDLDDDVEARDDLMFKVEDGSLG